MNSHRRFYRGEKSAKSIRSISTGEPSIRHVVRAGVQDGQCRMASVLLMSVLSKAPRHNTSHDVLCPTQGGNKSRVRFFLPLHSFKKLTSSLFGLGDVVRSKEFCPPSIHYAHDNK